MAEMKTQPWTAPSHNSNNPGGAVRQRLYLVLEHEREVHVLRVVGFELPDS